MIRIKSITIKDFRGIRDLTVDFNEKNFIIYGPNGTGKSGVVEALEFALTGKINQIDYASHIDSLKNPENAKVLLTITIPNLGKEVIIERNVNNPEAPKISPLTPSVIEVLEEVAKHPEFVLSRRQIIKYIITSSGDRAREVQALLHLDEVENLRNVLQKIANSKQKEVEPLSDFMMRSQTNFLSALGITEFEPNKILSVVNAKRAILSLPEISRFEEKTNLCEGEEKTNTKTHSTSEEQAMIEIMKLHEEICEFASKNMAVLTKRIAKQIETMNANIMRSKAMMREEFLQTSLELLENEMCPVCDSHWNLVELKTKIETKLKRFDEASEEIDEIKIQFEPIFEELGRLIESKSIGNIHKNVLKELEGVEKYLFSLQESSEQDIAREYLAMAQERLGIYRNIVQHQKSAVEQAKLSKKVFDAYAEVSTEVLEEIYSKVKDSFGELYRESNQNDESKFEACLVPTVGKLDLDVEFYGRGYFPPDAYHSEGHQDVMGICLYLALMKYLMGKSFSLVVLDDVMVSVDTEHRRGICKMLLEHFPDTQFIITTHDGEWLKNMVKVGLVEKGACIQFESWSIDCGPKVI